MSAVPPGAERRPALHIGWWRNGFHPYGRVREPAKVSEMDIQTRGAFLATRISMAWLAGSVVLALILWVINSQFVVVPVLVAIGAVAALPVSFVLGWLLAVRAVRSRTAFLPMVVLTVLLTDIEIGVVVGVAAVAMSGNLTGLAYTAIAIPFGLLFYGLPGLAIAVPSAWFWEHRMRRRFSQPAPGGGGRGSGDPRR